ncbi:MAG: PaaI family thioesterase [Pseudomonadota bacterium]
MDVQLSADEITEFLDDVFPQIRGEMSVEAVRPMAATVRMPVRESHLRPGGTVSGPAMFALADCSFYIAVLAMIGREALTVTTTLTINFLRKPDATTMIAEARILKLGKLLASGDVLIYSEGQEAPVAHAVVTYAIPPAR